MPKPMTADTLSVAGLVIERLERLDESLGYTETFVVGKLDMVRDGDVVGHITWSEDFGAWVLEA